MRMFTRLHQLLYQIVRRVVTLEDCTWSCRNTALLSFRCLKLHVLHLAMAQLAARSSAALVVPHGPSFSELTFRFQPQLILRTSCAPQSRQTWPSNHDPVSSVIVHKTGALNCPVCQLSPHVNFIRTRPIIEGTKARVSTVEHPCHFGRGVQRDERCR